MFTSEKIKTNTIVKEAKTVILESVFDKYVRITLEKIDRSISDARGRYEEGKAYGIAKPSLNWKVVGQKVDGEVMSEECLIWLKVGIKKVEVNGLLQTKVSASTLIENLLEYRQMIEFVRDNRDSEAAQGFHQVAIDQARPKTLSKNGNEFTYDEDADRYVEVTS